MSASACTASGRVSEKSLAMSERDRMDAFDTRLMALARAYTDPAVVPIDPLLTARTAMASTTRAGRLGRLWSFGLDRRLVRLLLLAALLIAIAALAVAVGTHPSPIVQPASGPGRIVFIRAGDVFVVDGNGANERRIARGGAEGTNRGYLTALWSPDVRRIAAVRDGGGDVPALRIDILSADGAVSSTLDLEPAEPPLLAWSPDGTELAVASLSQPSSNGNVLERRSVVDLLIVGTNGAVKRKLDLPGEAPPFVVDEFFPHNRQIAWSPDGRWISLPPTDSGRGFWVISPDGSGWRDLLPSTIVTNLSGAKEWAPDGHRIGYVNGVGGSGVGCPDGCTPGSVWTVGFDGGPATFMVGPTVDGDPTTEDEQFGAFAWSPDGQEMAIVSFRKTMEDRATKSFSSVQSLQRFDTRLGRLLPVTSGTLAIRGENVLTVTGDVVGPSLFWTPDGRRIFYATNEPGVMTIDPGVGAPGSIASIDAAGAGPSSIVVRDVQTYDIGFPAETAP